MTDTGPAGVPGLAEYLAKRERTAKLRAELAAARAAGPECPTWRDIEAQRNKTQADLPESLIDGRTHMSNRLKLRRPKPKTWADQQTFRDRVRKETLILAMDKLLDELRALTSEQRRSIVADLATMAQADETYDQPWLRAVGGLVAAVQRHDGPAAA